MILYRILSSLKKVIPLGRTFGGIILTPTATKCFSKEDTDIVLKHGIAVVG
jgi:ribosome biogenesis protein Tsr3